MYIFGGSAQIGYLNDLYILDTESPPGSGEEIRFTWGRPQISVTGDPPQAREGHSAAMWKNRIFYFGGFGDVGYVSDMLVLDTGELRLCHHAGVAYWGHSTTH